MAKPNVAQEVASVMQKIARVTEGKDESKGTTIYTAEQKVALEEARSCIERLLVEFNQVQLDRDAVQQEAFASTEFYEEELRSKKEHILELEMKIEQKEEFIVSLQKEWQEKYQQQAMALTKEKAEVINQLHAAQDELASIETFRKYQNERLQEELSMHVDVTNGLQKEKCALQSETAKLARDLDLLRQAEALHLQRSSSQARCIAENNNKLQKLEQSLGQIIRQYSSERRELEEEHKKKMASVQIEKQTLKRLAQTKIIELKKVRQLAQQFLRERGEVEAFLIESLHQVMDQKRSVKLSKKPQHMTSHSHPGLLNETKTSLPLITSSLGPPSFWPGNGSPLRCRNNTSPIKCISQGPKRTVEVMKGEKHVPIFQSLEEVPVKTAAPKLDISQLTWEEREKVLRHLFQRIHSANQLSQQFSDGTTTRHAGYDLLYESAANDDMRAFS